MISSMSRADVKNVLLIMHTDSVIPGVFHQSNPPTLGMLLNEVITNEENGETNELYALPLTILLDGGLPVELPGNGFLSKEELLKELATKTSVAAFMEEWEQFQILRIKNSNRYLIRPDKKSVIQKGTVSGNQVFFYNEL